MEKALLIRWKKDSVPCDRKNLKIRLISNSYLDGSGSSVVAGWSLNNFDVLV